MFFLFQIRSGKTPFLQVNLFYQTLNYACKLHLQLAIHVMRSKEQFDKSMCVPVLKIIVLRPLETVCFLMATCKIVKDCSCLQIHSA